MDTIYVIDDEPVIRRLYRTAFVNAHFSVSTFSNGTDLIRQHPVPPDLVLVDLLMPGPRGDEVIRFCRNQWRWTQTKYCLVTGSLAFLRDLGATPDVAFEKPVVLKDLVMACRRLLPAPLHSRPSDEALSPIDSAVAR